MKELFTTYILRNATLYITNPILFYYIWLTVPNIKLSARSTYILQCKVTMTHNIFMMAPTTFLLLYYYLYMTHERSQGKLAYCNSPIKILSWLFPTATVRYHKTHRPCSEIWNEHFTRTNLLHMNPLPYEPSHTP
jgi:hypothetical protein